MVLVGALLSFTGLYASAGTGIRALDEAAIQVKAPDKVFLVAVANAGSRVVAVGEHGVIVYSDDEGASWRQASVPVTVTLTAVAFADARRGWAVGHYGVVLHTRDGGAHWAVQLNGLQANRLTLAAAEASVTANSTVPAAHFAMKRAHAFLAQGPDNPFLCILVQSPQDATVFGAYRLAMKTADGGGGWADWSLHIEDALSHNIYAVLNTRKAIYLAGEEGLVFISTDGGSTYAASPSPGPVTIFGMLGAGGGGILAYGVAGLANRSTDGGTTWQPVNIGTSTNLTAGLVLKTGQILLAAEDGRLFESADQAATFKPLRISVPMAVAGVDEAADGGIIFVGNDGIVRVPAASLN
jgi:photosystem II stability/assembly factor-like uncharacterized protein